MYDVGVQELFTSSTNVEQAKESGSLIEFYSMSLEVACGQTAALLLYAVATAATRLPHQPRTHASDAASRIVILHVPDSRAIGSEPVPRCGSDLARLAIRVLPRLQPAFILRYLELDERFATGLESLTHCVTQSPGPVVTRVTSHGAA